MRRDVRWVLGATVLLGAASARANPPEGTWYDASLTSYQFQPDGQVFRSEPAPHGIARKPARFRVGAGSVTIDVTDDFSQESWVGRLLGDAIQLARAGSPESTMVLRRAPECSGTATACEAGVFCTGREGRTTYWRHPEAAVISWAGVPADFGTFLPSFTCAVRLGLKDFFLPMVAVPLRERLLSMKESVDQVLTAADLDSGRLERDFGPEGFSVVQVTPGGGSVDVVIETFDSIGSVRFRSPKELRFERQGKAWRLVAVERPATLPASVEERSRRWFQLKTCNATAIRSLNDQLSAAQGEMFEPFVRRFYCAVKLREAAWYGKRVRLPLPFTVHGFDGEVTGAHRSLEDLRSIGTVDGGEAPLKYSAQGDDGKAYMGSDGGTSNTWIFRRRSGKWLLVRMEMTSY